MTTIDTIEQLEAIYGPTNEASLVKVADHVTEQYRAFVEASPFVALATSGPEGLDCSPRGDRPGFVRMLDAQTLVMPDRKGNNRCDSLRNIVRDPRAAFLFLIPGSGNCLRVNGRARLSIDPELLASLAEEGKPPRSAIVLTTEAVYFQCARAIVRSRLWDPDVQIDPRSLPTAGQILACMSQNRVGGEAYDREWPERAKASLW
ncbi:pyridoxamine 5'-phosphate oxidase family protein [Phenylobacterium terrae]|uniref:Pyridoxamine 5'-phosphate oxidase family protein n=1 Tax=Phenylobacterium terrae TaxID=2665495 RepID=A0ABW4N6Q8_9CAUL